MTPLVCIGKNTSIRNAFKFKVLCFTGKTKQAPATTRNEERFAKRKNMLIGSPLVKKRFK